MWKPAGDKLFEEGFNHLEVKWELVGFWVNKFVLLKSVMDFYNCLDDYSVSTQLLSNKCQSRMRLLIVCDSQKFLLISNKQVVWIIKMIEDLCSLS